MLQAFWWLDRRAAAELEAAGEEAMSASEALTLTRIPGAGVRPVELARLAGVSRQAVHQTLDRLQDAGMTERARSPGRGAVVVRLTASGQHRARAVVRANATAEEALARRIGRERAAGLRAALLADWGDPGSA